MKTHLFQMICLVFLAGTILTVNSCQKKTEGCTDSTALNFNPDAERDDGSCFKFEEILIGEWVAYEYLFNGVNQLGSSLNSVKFILEADRNIKVEAVNNAQQMLTGTGTWKFNTTSKNLEFDLGASGYMVCSQVTIG